MKKVTWFYVIMALLNFGLSWDCYFYGTYKLWYPVADVLIGTAALMMLTDERKKAKRGMRA